VPIFGNFLQVPFSLPPPKEKILISLQNKLRFGKKYLGL